MKVILISHTPDPEKLIAASAKLCYSDSSIDDISEKLDEKSINSFIGMLNEIGHESPMEHAVFTFGIEGVSRSLLAQLTRHRIASFSVQSQRYVCMDNFDYVIPPEIEDEPDALAEFLSAVEEDRAHYEKLRVILTKKHFEKALTDKKNLGGSLSPDKLRLKPGREVQKLLNDSIKKANEDARYILPNACQTKIVMTMNARSLHNFFRLRTCMRAQWEIRELSEKMLTLVKSAAPVIFKNAGPPCVSENKCREGVMSCGLSGQMRGKYKRVSESISTD